MGKPFFKVVYNSKRYRLRVEQLVGKADYQFEVYLINKKLGVSGTIEAWKTQKLAMKHTKKIIKELKQREQDYRSK